MKTLTMLRRREDEALDAPLKRLDAATAQSSGRLVDEVNTASANIRYEILLPVNIALAGRLRSMWHYDMQNAMRDARVFQAMNVFGRPGEPSMDTKSGNELPRQHPSKGEEPEALRKLAESLAHERTVLRTMIDLIPAFIYAKDAHSRFTACNALVAKRLGTIPSEMIGKTDFDFFPREMAENFFAEEQALIASGQPLIDLEEVAFDKVRGENRVILTSKVPLKDDNGRLTGIVGTGYDITERKAVDQKLMAMDRHESIGRLAAGLAHEINTPIQYLSDSVRFIDEGVHELLEYLENPAGGAERPSDVEEEIGYLRQELPSALKRVADGLGRIAEVVRSIKDFARADISEMAAVDINQSIKSTLVVARSEYQAVAEIQTDLGELPPVVCHGGQINIVILNLLVNAAHAITDVKGSSERGLITVRTRAEGDNVVISVSDTGGGIREEIRHRIFDPFFTTKEVGRGSGQGLTIARNVVVKVHGGTIDFTTEIGEGTTFEIRLPTRPTEMAAPRGGQSE
jgi:PAS domain S-box-containing protein